MNLTNDRGFLAFFDACRRKNFKNVWHLEIIIWGNLCRVFRQIYDNSCSEYNIVVWFAQNNAALFGATILKMKTIKSTTVEVCSALQIWRNNLTAGK